MGQRIVTGPVVVLPDATTGKTAYYYQGSVLPDGLDEDRVKAVIADGLVSEELDVTALTVDDLSAAAAGDRFRQGGVLPAEDEAPAEDEDSTGDAPPPKAAAKSAWVDFAVARGADRAEAEKASKDDLIATHGA